MDEKKNNLENIELSGGLSPGGYAELCKIAYPLIITNATHTIMQFIDRKFLAMNATNDVAAALPGGILAFTFFTFFMLTTGFTAAIVAQYYGKKNYVSCARVPWTGFYFALLSGVFCSLCLFHPGMFLIEAGKHSPALILREKAYFRMILPSGGFIFITAAFCSFFSGRGKTWTVAIVHFIASAVNVLLDYMLIFGKFGAPQMGIAGAGLATTLACITGAVIAFLYFIFHNQKVYPTRKDWHFNKSDMHRLISFGTPAGFQVFCSVGAFAMIVFLIGRIGSTELAATTIALSVNMMTFMPLMGISEATGIITGKYVGARMHKFAESATFKAWKLSTAYMICMGIFYVAFPEHLLKFFAPSKGGNIVEFANVMKIGKTILIFAAIYNVLNVMRFVFMGALRGAGDTRIPMWIMMGASWIILAPGGYIIIAVLQLKIFAIWTFLTCYGGVVGCLIFWRFKSGVWKKLEIVSDEPDSPTEPPLIESLKYESERPHV